MTVLAVVIGVLLGGACVGVVEFALRKRASPRVSATATGGAAALVLIVALVVALVPNSLRDFSLRARRIGVENLLREFQRDHSSCLRTVGPCSEADLRIVRSRGCTALNGTIDPGWNRPCELSPEIVELTSGGGLLLAVFREDGMPADVWLLRPHALFTVGPSHTAPRP
jgi:hypothetical protein